MRILLDDFVLTANGDAKRAKGFQLARLGRGFPVLRRRFELACQPPGPTGDHVVCTGLNILIHRS